jgi:hypothetical protein
LIELEASLQRAPADRFKRIAETYLPGLDAGGPDAPCTLARAMLEGWAVLDGLGEFSREQHTALKIIALGGGGKGVVIEQCHQKLNRMTRKWRRNGAQVIDALMRRGLVFVDRQNYRQVYYVPKDLRDKLLPVVAGDMIARSTCQGVDTVETGEDPNLALRLIHFLLAYVKKSGVRLTQNGEIFRRSQRGLEEILGIDETAVNLHEDRPGRPHIFIDFIRSRGLVRQSDSVLELVPDKAESWIEQDAESKRRDLFEYLQERIVSLDPDFSTILSFLCLLPYGSWAVVSRMLEELEPVGLSHAWQALPARLERFFFSHLGAAGVVAAGQVNGELACRLTPLGRHLLCSVPAPDHQWDNSFFVEPNFEMLVPRDISLDILWAIEQVADLVKHDQVMVYMISKSSVYRAMQDGYDAESLIEFLSRYSNNPVPQNIVFSIRDWCSRFGHMWVESVVLLRCKNEELAYEVQSMTALREFIVGSLTPRDLIIDGHRVEEFMNALQEYGFMPLPGVIEKEPGPRKPDAGH